MGSRKEYEMLFKLNAQLGGAYNSSFKAAQQTVTQMQNELQALNKVQADISAYQKQQEALEGTRSKLQLLQQQYDNIQKELSETEGFSASLENRLLSKQQQIEKTSASIETQEAKLHQLGGALQEAGVDTTHLTGENQRLSEQYQSLKTEQEAIADNFQNGGDSARMFGEETTEAVGAIQEVLVAAGIAAALKEITEWYKECIDASIEFESAMTGVSKTTDLTDSELTEMSQAMKNLSTEIPITTTDLAAVSEAAGQLGIGKDSLLDFSTVMSMLGTATDMTADEAATMLAQFANITQMDPAFYSNLGSTIVDLGNNFATTERKITEMSQGIAASGSLAGLSEADMLGLSAAVSSLGIESAMGSTSVSKLISMLMTAVETGEDLDDIARVAGMSAQDFSQAWGENAAGALEKFVVGLSDTTRLGDSAIVTLSDLGVTETRMQRTILSMSNSGDLLSRSLSMANQAWEENTALQNEAEKRYATTESQLILLGNSYNNLKVAVGDVFVPSLRELTAVSADVLDGMSDFVQEHPEAVAALTAIAGGVGIFTAALVAYKVAVTVAKAVTAAFNSILLANPYYLVAAGIVAASAALVAFAALMRDTEEDVSSLSAVSRDQYYELEDLKAQYQEVCDTYGETSDEAQALKEKVDEATAAFEDNKQTTEEVAEAHQKVMDAYRDMVQAQQEVRDSIDKESEDVSGLIAELESLMSIEGKTATTKQEILGIVELLNEAVPELSLSYDEFADSLNLTADAIKKVAEAEADKKRNEADHDALLADIENRAALEEDLRSKQEQRKAAEEDLAEAIRTKNEAEKDTGIPIGGMAGFGAGLQKNAYADTVREAQEEVDNLKAAEQKAKDAYDQNEQAIDDLSKSLSDYSAEAAAAATPSLELNAALTEAQDRAEELGKAYQDAYENAYSGISGAAGLFEGVTVEVETSVSEMISALESQASYMDNYTENLKLAAEMGLSEGLLAELSDGSVESAAYLQEIVNNGGEKIGELNDAFAKVQDGKAQFADTVAEMQTDFSKNMDEIVADLQQTVGEMDLHEQAAQSGYNTIDGFISAATSPDTLAKVSSAYSRVAQEAKAAIDNTLGIHSPSRATMWSGEMTGEGLIEGAEQTLPDMKRAMKSYASEMAEAMTPDISQVVMITPALMSQMAQFSSATLSPTPEVSAVPATSSGYQILIQPVYHIYSSGNDRDIDDQLRRHDDELEERIRTVLEEMGIDERRTQYW